MNDFPLLVDTDTGEWKTTSDGNRCASHWIGLLWLAVCHADDAATRERYEGVVYDYLDRMLPAEDVLGSMFAGMSYLYAVFRGYDVTGDRTLYGIGFTWADVMVDLFDEYARIVPSRQLRRRQSLRAIRSL